MWAQPAGSTTSEMKSARLRLAVGGQAMPRLQMSPMCIGATEICDVVQVGAWLATPLLSRLSDCPAHRNQRILGVHGGPTLKQPPGNCLPLAELGTTLSVLR